MLGVDEASVAHREEGALGTAEAPGTLKLRMMYQDLKLFSTSSKMMDKVMTIERAATSRHHQMLMNEQG